MVQPLDGGGEGALGGEGADVKLVDHAAGQLPAVPALVGPGERVRVVGPGPAVHAVRLPAGPGIGKDRVGAVEHDSRSRTRSVPPSGSRPSGSGSAGCHHPSSSRLIAHPLGSAGAHRLDLQGDRCPAAGPRRRTARAHSAHPTAPAQATSWMPNRARTPARISRASASRSIARRRSPVGQGQGVLAGQPRRPAAVALAETGVRRSARRRWS